MKQRVYIDTSVIGGCEDVENGKMGTLHIYFDFAIFERI